MRISKTDEKNNTGAAGALSFDLPAEYAAAFYWLGACLF